MKRKGFTLIELLAVIVVLAIIALIATPIVMNVIENARKSAVERSAENYIRAVETSLVSTRLNGNKASNGIYEISEDGNLCLVSGCTDDTKILVETSGTIPENLSFSISNNSIISDKLLGRAAETAVISGVMTKETDTETGINYVKVTINLDALIDDGSVMTLSSNLEYNSEKLTFQEYEKGDVYINYLVSTPAAGNVTMVTVESRNNKKIGTYLTIVFTTDDLDAVTPEDFSYRVTANNWKGVDITIKESDISDIKIVNGPNLFSFANRDSVQNYSPGDINNDGFLDGYDLVLLKKQQLGTQGIEPCKAMDVNGDEVINILDMIRLQKMLIGDAVGVYSPMTGIPDHL